MFAAALLLIITAGMPAPLPHVRGADTAARMLIGDGLRRSTAFQSLVAALDTRRVVVFVTVPASCPARGVLRFVSRAAGTTYLSACVDARQNDARRLGVLAHELRHALEVAEARTPVTSAADLERLYRDIGSRIGPGVYETRAAEAAERLVLREALAAGRSGAHRLHEPNSSLRHPT